MHHETFNLLESLEPRRHLSAATHAAKPPPANSGAQQLADISSLSIAAFVATLNSAPATASPFATDPLNLTGPEPLEALAAPDANDLPVGSSSTAEIGAAGTSLDMIAPSIFGSGLLSGAASPFADGTLIGPSEYSLERST